MKKTFLWWYIRFDVLNIIYSYEYMYASSDMVIQEFGYFYIVII